MQSLILTAWNALNLLAFIKHWDPYPFILLNLALSFQAAYAAPFIMMSQNRQQDIDRQAAENDYHVNIKAELEIELLHQKIDELRETEVLHLTEVVHEQNRHAEESRRVPQSVSSAAEYLKGRLVTHRVRLMLMRQRVQLSNAIPKTIWQSTAWSLRWAAMAFSGSSRSWATRMMRVCRQSPAPH